MKMSSQENLRGHFKLKESLHNRKLKVKDLHILKRWNSFCPVISHWNQLKVPTTSFTYIILYLLYDLQILLLKLIGSS